MKITLTGVDARTDRNALRELIADYPELEIGILYSEGRAGNENRYPTLEQIAVIAKDVHSKTGADVALHVCGALTRTGLLSGWLEDVVCWVQRIQVNGTVLRSELFLAMDLYPNHTIITQGRPENELLLNLFDAPIRNMTERHAILIDASGGRGIVPEVWRFPQFKDELNPKAVGFAGGLNTENLANELRKITATVEHARACYSYKIREPWIDIETGCRNADDLFDLTKARQLCETFRANQNK